MVIGPVPPPIHGESLAIKLLIEAKEVNGMFRLTVINTNRKRTEKGGRLSLVKLVQDVGMLFRVWRLVRKDPPDILYLSLSQTRLGLVRDAILLRLTEKKAGKVVAHLHGNNLKNVLISLNPALKRFVVPALNRIESGIALSRNLAFNFMGLPAHVAVVPNGIDRDYFSNGEITSARSGVRSGLPFRILYLSNLMETKGFAPLIQATADLLCDGYPVELWLAGQLYDRPLFDQTMEEAGAAGCTDKITYLGTVTGTRKKQLLRDADVMVLPTTYPIEGQPISIIEGMASGLPIISSAQGAIPELIEGSGIVLRTINRETLAAAIRRLLADRSLYQQYSQTGRHRFLNNYTLDQYIGGLVATFNRGE